MSDLSALRVNGEPMSVDDGATIADLVAPPRRGRRPEGGGGCRRPLRRPALGVGDHAGPGGLPGRGRERLRAGLTPLSPSDRRWQNHSMPERPQTGPTAFVLAGGGTKGSFEVGVLQYLVGVERIAPEIITAASAGAIAATVLAQARTLEEFEARVDEMEEDVLAFTHTENGVRETGMAAPLDGTALGREIHYELTDGAPAAVPPQPHRRAGHERGCAAAGRTGAPRAPSGQAGPAQAPAAPPAARRRGGAAPATGAPPLPHGGSAVLNLEPLASALRQGSKRRVRRSTPRWWARPGLQLHWRSRRYRRRRGRHYIHRGRHDRRGGARGRPPRAPRPAVRALDGVRVGERAAVAAPLRWRTIHRRRRVIRCLPRRRRSSAPRLFAVVAGTSGRAR